VFHITLWQGGPAPIDPQKKGEKMSQKIKFIGCRVTEEEYLDIRQQAENAGTTLSIYIRRMLMQQPIIKIYQPKELLYQLLAIGRNINQIARQCNIAQTADTQSILAVQQEWKAVKDEVIRFIAGADITIKKEEDQECQL
jgi:hypothetical protein